MYVFKRAIQLFKQEGVKRVVRGGKDYLSNKIKFFTLPYAIFRIKSLNNNSTLAELVDFSFNGVMGLIKPTQIKYEITKLLRIIHEIKPKTIIEIGTSGGGTLFLFSKIASEDATIISIDLPSGEFGGGYPRWKVPLYKSFKKQNQNMHLLREDSHKEETFEKVKNILDGEEVGLWDRNTLSTYSST